MRTFHNGIVSKVTPILAVYLTGILLLALAPWVRADNNVSSFATSELQLSVGKLNAWLNGSPNAEGWRKYLLLNVLDTQSAKGEFADVSMLQKVLSRFSGDVDGLGRPEFNDVRIALERQISILNHERFVDLPSTAQAAFSQYRPIQIEDLEHARDTAVYELELLKRYYRKTLPSRPRAEIFYDLKLDQQVALLESLEFELPPEASVGKVTSMLRDELERLKEIEEEIDALPAAETEDDDEDDYGDVEDDYGDDEDDYGDDEDDYEEDEDEDEQQSDDEEKDDSKEADSDISDEPLLTPPGPDDGETTLKELETKAKQIEVRIEELKELRLDLQAKDADRVATRTSVLKQLAEFNEGYRKVAQRQRDPWFVATALVAERFNFLYFYGTDDNLQEDYLERTKSLVDLLEQSPDLSDRSIHGEVGKLIQWFESAGQAPKLVSAVRAMHSNPNMYLTISSRLINSQLDGDVSRRQRVKEIFFGRIVRGTANVSGNVQVVLRPDPNQVNVAIELFGAITSQTYSKERNWRINASSCANYSARRELFANVGGLHSTDVQSSARASSTYGGITSQIDLVQKLAAEKFAKLKYKNDTESSRRIKAQITEPFTEQTDAAVEGAQEGLINLNTRIEAFSSFVPQVFARTYSDYIEIVANKSDQGNLGAPGMPAQRSSTDITLALHETMLANYIDPLLAGKTFTNTELREEVERELGIDLPDADEETEADLKADGKVDDPDGEETAEEEVEEDKEFSITFARVRPVQFEFKDNQLAVIVTGTRFAQGGRSIRAGLSFRVTFRIIDDGGTMKLQRVGDADIKLTDPEQKSAKLIAFRDFLEKRLNDGLNTEDGIELPPNFIPTQIADEQPIAGDLALMDLRMEGGWIYAGWNFAPGYSFPPNSLAAVWGSGQMNPTAIEFEPPAETPQEPPSEEQQLEEQPLEPKPESEDEQAPPMPELSAPVMSVVEGEIIFDHDPQAMDGQIISGEISSDLYSNEVIIDGTNQVEVPVMAPVR